MIEITRGNLLTADAEALVNSVNTDGYMGRDRAAVEKRSLRTLKPTAAPANRASAPRQDARVRYRPLWHPRYIINFPTKRNWRANSRLEDIESGLQALVQEIRRLGIRLIAVPPLGCGLGGLDWRWCVRLSTAPSLLSPMYACCCSSHRMCPSPATMPIGTQRPHLTPARALLIQLIEQYTELTYRLTLLEVQKLTYFLQEPASRCVCNIRKASTALMHTT